MPTPYIVCRRAVEAIEFYKRALGATELFRMTDPSDGRLGHAELDFGDTRLMLADEYPDFGALSPETVGGTPVTLHLAVGDVDAVTARAEAAGATVLRRPATQSFGERVATLLDPFGHRWQVTTTVEHLMPEDMQRRWVEGIG